MSNQGRSALYDYNNPTTFDSLPLPYLVGLHDKNLLDKRRDLIGGFHDSLDVEQHVEGGVEGLPACVDDGLHGQVQAGDTETPHTEALGNLGILKHSVH
jgi:hypothetical protein